MHPKCTCPKQERRPKRSTSPDDYCKRPKHNDQASQNTRDGPTSWRSGACGYRVSSADREVGDLQCRRRVNQRRGKPHSSPTGKCSCGRGGSSSYRRSLYDSDCDTSPRCHGAESFAGMRRKSPEKLMHDQCSAMRSARPQGLGGGRNCQRCGRKVYQAEMQQASGTAYHKICFSCLCCRKLLEPLTYHENCGQIFCKQCHIRNFGPQGYGYGVGAGALQTPL